MKLSIKINFFFSLLAVLLLIPLTALAYCGDGGLEPQEECDDGNFIDRDGCSAYCQMEDMTPPAVSSVSIPNNSTGVSTLTNEITVIFSEPVDKSSINIFNIVLKHQNEPLDITRTLSDDGITLQIHINQELFSLGSHALVIRNVKDLVGNILEGEYSGDFISVFETAEAVDNKPPTVVVSPPGNTYHFPQNVEIKAYIDDYTKSDEFLDDTATVYYTINDVNITNKSPQYKTPIPLREGSTLRYFAVDGLGNKTDVVTMRYSFKCPVFENAKVVNDKYPVCEVVECDYGFALKSNTCVVRLDSNLDDYKSNAVTAPLFPSDTPMTITTKPAIYVTREHKGIIARPVIFKDSVRGTTIFFEKNTKITKEDGRPFEGYIKNPENLYLKDFPINFGYSFQSIFQFRSAEGESLQFSPPIKMTIPYGEAWNPDEAVIVFIYNPSTESYSEYSRGLYSTDLKKHEVTISSYRTQKFFIAQSGKNFNKSIFQDVTTHWAKNYIEALYRKGIVKGRDKNIFAPNENLTRAEFIKIALNSAGIEADSPDDIDSAPFTDVPLFAWYAPYVKKAKDLGLTGGYEDGTFQPDQFINRAEAVKVLFSAFGFDMSRTPDIPSEMADKHFTDLRTSSWFYPYANFAIQFGIMQGSPGNHESLRLFNPGSAITRAEMAKLAIKTIELSETIE